MTKKEIIELIEKTEAEYWNAFEAMQGNIEEDAGDYKQVKYGWIILFALKDAIINGDNANIENKLNHISNIRKMIEEMSA